MKTNFIEKVYLGKVYGVNTYLAAPSWDCNWYWGFGYIQNEDLHTHFDSLSKTKNMWDSVKEYFDDGTLSIDDEKLWKLCELMRTFYTLKETAEVYHRGGSNYGFNPLKEILKDEAQYKKINFEILPSIFDEVYKIFNK